MITRCLIFLTLLIFPFLPAAGIPLNENDLATASVEPAGSSVLSSGKWYKIKIKSTGIYKLTYDELVSMGFSDPSNISLFGNGGRMLPLINGVPRRDDLTENPVYMNNGTDGIFNQGDFILFYAEGPVSWDYDEDDRMFLHKIHQFSDASYYFLTTETGQKLRIAERTPVTGSPDFEIRSFTDYSYHEKNRYNFLESGRQWFGERIDIATFDSVFTFTGLQITSPVSVKVNVAARSDGARIFTLRHDNSVIGTIGTSKVVLTDKDGARATQKEARFSFNSGDDQINLRLSFNNSGSEDEGYLDYFTVNARRRLALTGNFMFFRDTTGMGTPGLASYFIENSTPQTEIWDVTSPFNIVKVPAELSGGTLRFLDSTRSLREYVVFNTASAFEKPVTESDLDDTGIIPNQNLHGSAGVQMLIVTHPDFIAAADSIAEYHRTNDGLSVIVATTKQIYNEFSSGAPDISAIRDYAKMVYDRGSGENRLRFLLLVGDGSYNNLSRSSGNSNFILTYQSENSLHAGFSYVSDDFYGFMEDGEGGSSFMEDFSLDIGVGRLPVKTAQEALDLYRKIKNYNNTASTKGDWQNNILFAGDDQDGNLHMNQANQLASWIENTYPEYTVKKVFIDAYPQVASSSGTRYPDVNRILKNNIERGLLIFNYTGHGGEIGLADEQILMREDLSGLTNFDHLPLFITATCEFSRFDDLTRGDDGIITESTSAGEYSILNPIGGTIALVSTTRIVWSSDNHQLNTRFLQIALDRDDDGNYRPLGEIMRMTKNILGQNRNKLNFILLGDPALRLAIPSLTVVTDSVNQKPVTETIDTMKAFSSIIVSGHIENYSGEMQASYNGTIYPSVYDKNKNITTLANDIGAFPMQFTVREDLLYKGKASVSDGKFRFEFKVPKDITYNYGNGKITYFSNNTETDAKGSFSSFIIGGTDRTVQPDNAGPEISLYLNDEQFNNKGITNQNPIIYATINDESGINTIGNGIGHDITGIIDNETTNPVVMNDFFETDLDNYTSGILKYPMFGLSEGMHTLRVKVWDIFNNSSEATIEFRVVSDQTILISKAANFPNPANDHTSFIFEHNQAGEDLIATITVFDLRGRLIYTYTETIPASGFNTVTPVWDLRDTNGNILGPGIYPYRIRIKNARGSYADSYQKLVVVR